MILNTMPSINMYWLIGVQYMSLNPPVSSPAISCDLNDTYRTVSINNTYIY